VADALATTRACDGSGLVIVRADSAYYGRDVIAAARRGEAKFSITARMDPGVRRAISSIQESAWVAIRYPNAIWDQEQQRLISDAQVAEVPNTRVHLPPQVRAGDRAPDRAPGASPEPGLSASCTNRIRVVQRPVSSTSASPARFVGRRDQCQRVRGHLLLPRVAP